MRGVTEIGFYWWQNFKSPEIWIIVIQLVKIRVVWKTFSITSCYKNILISLWFELGMLWDVTLFMIMPIVKLSRVLQHYINGAGKPSQKIVFYCSYDRLKIWENTVLCQTGWNFPYRNAMISRWNFHLYVDITFGNYETAYSLFWTVQFLIGFRSVKEHFSFPYLFGFRETSEQEWTNHIAQWYITAVGVDGKVLGGSEDFRAGCCGRRSRAAVCWTQLAAHSSTTGLLQATAESIIQPSGTDRSLKGLRPMDEHTRRYNSPKGTQTVQHPHWSMRKKWEGSSSR